MPLTKGTSRKKPSKPSPTAAQSPAMVVRSLIGQARGRGARRSSLSHLVEQIHAGLPVEEIDDLRAGLDVPLEQLTRLLGISRATLNRRRRGQVLGVDESDRVVRYARLLGWAVEVMESLPDARLWLKTPQVGLGGAVPLEYARTEAGARQVDDLLGRIEHGVYS